MAGALHGIRVIDFGQYIAGPLAAVLLSDQGAEVIHVDPPGGPRWRHPADAFLNRGKRRLILDLKTSVGVTTAQRLIDSADVIIENFRPGVMERLGLGVQEMTQRNPNLIYSTIPGFAADDPRAGLHAWEGILDAATENCIPRAGEPPPEWDATRPTYSALTLASNFGAFLSATGIVMALIARQRSGKGQHVDVPLFDAMFTLIGHSGAYLNARGLQPPSGIHGRGAGAFQCADGKYVQFDTSSPRHLTWFARAAGITSAWGPDLLDPNRNQGAEVNQRLHARLRELFRTRSAAAWEEIGNLAGASIGWVRTATEWMHTAQAQKLGAVVQLDDPELGPTWMAGLAVHLSESPGAPQGPRHLPDADHATVLAALDRLPPRPVLRATEPDLAHPLQGMKVIDLCLALAGPTCGRLLLEFGADVIKVQAPHAGVGGYLNRGKRSLLLDLQRIEAQQIFWRMVDTADVVLENFSPGTADRLGIGYEEVRARRPDIIYTSLSCYGQIGPWRHGRGWERQGQAVTGIMERTGAIPAVLGPYNLVDIGTGVLGTFTTALGLYYRLRTGKGQHVQASLCQTATYHQTPYMLDYQGAAVHEPRGYEALGSSYLNRFYQAQDRWFFMAARPQQAPLLRAIEGLHIDRLNPLDISKIEQMLEDDFVHAPASVWAERLGRVGISAHEKITVAELMADPTVRSRRLSITQDVEGVGEVTMPGLSVHLSRTPMRLGDRCHQPGKDGPAILKELGLDEKLEALEKAWVIQTKDLPSAWGRGQ
jgi:crotonobetainyl-CoA:carnitine CoA-transferase CaiB-like acyl-CoA transferase